MDRSINNAGVVGKAQYEADVVVIGFGGAGACAAIEAHDAGAEVLLLEKQSEENHHPNTRMSLGAYHSPHPDADRQALKEYAKAMFSGENLPGKLEGEQPEFSDELAQVWAEYAPQNAEFMRSLDPEYHAVPAGTAAYPHFPGAKGSRYGLALSNYTGREYAQMQPRFTKYAPKSQKEWGEAFYACLLNGIQTRGIKVHYETRAQELVVNGNGEVIGVKALCQGETLFFKARRAVIITSGGYEYNKRMRSAFLDGPGVEGWAFYGTTANTGDGIEMALKVGAGLAKAGKIAGRIICAVPERRHGLKVGLSTGSVGKPNELVVDNYGRRFANERSITKDPSGYIFYTQALLFDMATLSYPRIPSWMIFDETMREQGPVVRLDSAAYNGIEWGEDNLKAIEKGWILKADSIEELAQKIAQHPDNQNKMDAAQLVETVNKFNRYCAAGEDLEFQRDPDTLGPVQKPPFYAIPLYPGGPNTKGGLRANAKRQVLTWQDEPIPRLYTAGEVASAFQFVYQGGGNLAECIVFGRVAGKHAAAEAPWCAKEPAQAAS